MGAYVSILDINPSKLRYVHDILSGHVTTLMSNRANIEEEFADVVAWLCTLANINDVDLAAAITKKYLGEKRPEGHK